MRILQVADLHLNSKEKDYCLPVLEEIVEVARENHVDCLLLCGDLFDSFKDIESLREDFRNAINRLEKPTYFIPGNHEVLRQGSGNLSSFDFGNQVQFLGAKPFSFERIEIDDFKIELIAIPHQVELADYREWKLPPKKERFRLAMAHGLVTGMSYTGPEVEEGGGAIDPDLFSRLEIDYAALGHIHDRRNKIHESTVISYSGSSRVWRAGELKERGVNLIDLQDDLGFRFVPLKKAGQYRAYDLPLTLEGKLPELKEKDLTDWQENDYIEVKLGGMIEDENLIKEIEAKFRTTYQKNVRKLDIRRRNISVLPGISKQPIASRFLSLWEEKKQVVLTETNEEENRETWLRARELGLEEIKKQLERTR